MKQMKSLVKDCKMSLLMYVRNRPPLAYSSPVLMTKLGLTRKAVNSIRDTKRSFLGGP